MIQECKNNTPVALCPDYTNMNDVLDMIQKQFDIDTTNRPKLKMLCDLYAVQYMLLKQIKL